MSADAAAPDHDPIESPVFLVGTTRSGTTLLSLMLGHHPAINFVGEFEWAFDAGPDGAGSLDGYYAFLAGERRVQRHGLSVDRALDYSGLVRSFLSQLCDIHDPRHEKPRVGCQVHRHYAAAHRLWPKARFIHLVRDGRDVCASWIRFGWLGNAFRGAPAWSAALSEWDELKPRLARDQYVEVRFEDLLSDPVGKLSEMCQLVGVPYDDAIMRYHEDTTYGPIDPGQAGKWAQQLSERDVRLFETLAGDDLARYGYALSGKPSHPVDPLTSRLLMLDNRARHNLARARHLGVRLWLADHVTRRLPLPGLGRRVQHEINALVESRLK